MTSAHWLVFAATCLIPANSHRAEDSKATAKQIHIRAKVLEFINDPRGFEKTKVVSEPVLSTFEGRTAYFRLGGEVPVADPVKGVRFVEYGKKVEASAKFIESGRIELTVTLHDIKLLSKPGETPRTKTDVRKETIEVEPGEVAKFSLGQAYYDDTISLRVELSVNEAPRE